MKKNSAFIPFNCVDKVLLSYEIAHQRLNFHLILSIQGKVDPDGLEQALLHVLQYYPTLRTVLRTRLFRHFREIEEVSEARILEVRDLSDIKSEAEHEKCIFEWINRPMDIKKGFPIRVLLLKKATNASTLIFTFHHSVIDGIRAVHFIDEVIARYDHRIPDESMPSYDVAMHGRGDELTALARCERPETKRFYWNMLYYMFHFIITNSVFRPSRIFHQKSGKSAEINFCSARVRPTEVRQIKSKAKSVGGTINDILLAACFTTIEKWNKQHGKDSKKLSIMVPVDIAQEANSVTTNRVSFLSVATRPEDRRPPPNLLKKVNAQTVSALRESRSCTFSYVYFSYFLSHFPLGVMQVFAKYVKFPILADTVLHSNLGIRRLRGHGEGETRKASFRVMDIVGLGPVINAMGMFIVIITYNGNLGVDLCYKTSCFSKEKAQAFLNLYLEEIKGYGIELEAEQSEHVTTSSIAGSPV